MKEILIYGGMYSWSAEGFINAVNEAGDEGITARINSDGGNVQDGWGMVAKFAEYKGKKNVKVDGRAGSMAAFFAVYADDVEALDVSEFMFHRAAYPSWIENDPNLFTPELKASLKKTNDKLRTAMEAKVDTAKLQSIKGVSMDDLFSDEKRVDVILTATEAKKIGLINRITNITPEKKADIERYAKIAASYSPESLRMAAETIEPKNLTMTIIELKAQHPALYAEVLALGVAQEKDRVEACLVYAEYDMPGVKAAIESGKPLSAKDMAAFNLKVVSGKKLDAIAADGAATPNPITTEVTAEATAKQKELDQFEANVKNHLKAK